MSKDSFVLSLEKHADFFYFKGYVRLQSSIALQVFYNDELKRGGICTFGLPEVKTGFYVFDAVSKDDALMKAAQINGMMLNMLGFQTKELLDVLRPIIVREELLESERHQVAQTG